LNLFHKIMLRRISESSHFRPVIISALLFAATVFLFSRAIGCGFLNYDDPSYITENPQVQGGLTWTGVVWAFTAPTANWHPLAWLSHMLDWQLYGPSASGHHFTNVLWHALNAVLAYLLFQRLAGGFWRSAFAAALFAWHPLRVESVAWVTERKDVMSGCFFLLTLLAYAGYVDARVAGRAAWRKYLLTLACFVAGLMSKPMLVTLPLVLLLMDFWPFKRVSSPATIRLLLCEKLPFLALALADAVATVLMQKHTGAFVLDVPIGARLANAAVSLARYLGKFGWPFDLVVCYPHPGTWPLSSVIAATTFVLGLFALAWRQRHSCPWIAVGLCWFIIILSPVLGLIQVGFQAMADRYTYLSMLGIELALLWSIPSATTRAGRVARSCAAVVLLAACALRTWNQIGVWRDSKTLFTHAVAVSDRNDVAEGFLASALFANSQFNEAAVHAERACALNPRNEQALATLASVREREGRTNEAVSIYRKALEIHPDNPVIKCQLGLLEFSLGNVIEARALMTDALLVDPALRKRTLEIGQISLQHGAIPGALFLFELVLAVDPDNPDAHAWVGTVLLASDDPAAAMVHLQAAAKQTPAVPSIQLTLARCAERLGQKSEASIALERAVEAAAGDPRILNAAAELYVRLGILPSAMQLYRRVIELNPTDCHAHAALGDLLTYEGNQAAGIVEWRRAFELDPNFPGLRERLQGP
jgi:tetratricopeptide (TPR) repeat protein